MPRSLVAPFASSSWRCAALVATVVLGGLRGVGVASTSRPELTARLAATWTRWAARTGHAVR